MARSGEASPVQGRNDHQNWDGLYLVHQIDHQFGGVIINNQLNWKNHLDHNCAKVSKNIGIILKARRVFDKRTLLSLYYSLMYPSLTYSIQVWGSTYQSHLSKLVILQKKIVRIIHGVPSRTHTEPLFSELNILKVSNLYIYNIALFMYNLNYSKLPDIFPMFVHNLKFINMNYNNWNISTFHHVALILVKCPSNIKGPWSGMKYLQI